MTADIIPFPARAEKKKGDAQLYAEALAAQRLQRGEPPTTVNADPREAVEVKRQIAELVQGARQVTEEERAEAATRVDKMERSGEAARMLAKMQVDSAERDFMLEHMCHTDHERAEMEGFFAAQAEQPECNCEVCKAGGNCIGWPMGNTIGELFAAAYNHGVTAETTSPKNRRLLLKAATELAARLAA